MAGVNSNTCAIFIDNDGDPVAITASTVDPAENDSSEANYPTGVKPIAFSTSANVSISNATYEVNFKTATAVASDAAPSFAATRAYNVGTQTGSMSFDGVVDFTDASDVMDIDALFQAVVGKTKITAIWASTDTNANAYGAQGYMTSFELSSAVDDFATFSGSIELTGDITEI